MVKRMDLRLALQSELERFSNNVYFQPPSNIQLKYPCIVYNKTDATREFGNNRIYYRKQGYQITVIDKNPDSVIPDNLESHFEYCVITDDFVTNNLNHTILNLHY